MSRGGFSEQDDGVAARIDAGLQELHRSTPVAAERGAQAVGGSNECAVVPRVRQDEDQPIDPSVATLQCELPGERLLVGRTRFDFDAAEDRRSEAGDHTIPGALIAAFGNGHFGRRPQG